MKAVLVPIVVVGALTGCFASRPAGNVGFGEPHTLRELEGVYLNHGEGDPKGSWPGYLSSLIWPKVEGLDHPTIHAIEVRAIGDSALLIRAHGSAAVERDEVQRVGTPAIFNRDRAGAVAALKEQTFVSGKDFEFVNGRLRLRPRWDNSLKTPEAGGLFVARVTQELGVDKKGQGKYKTRETVAGAAYLVVPIAATSTTEVRFVRLEEK